jgi:Relaxase/Mobilisation nuclease domain
MPRPLINLSRLEPFLDLRSYARPGPARRDRLSSAQVALIARTVHRTPEVMVKMLNQGGTSLRAVRRHIQYLDRGGELVIETDDGEPLKGKGAALELLEDWDLDLDEKRPAADLKPWWGKEKKQPKLVQKILFSMPAGTPPKKVLAAVKSFAREEFGAKHRYAMVLHTDAPHPHVHLVVRAMSFDGRRLNIRRDTLREWRREFARHLREQGVAANATERAVRGVTQPRKTDGIYRAGLRGVSTHWRRRAEAVARELASGAAKVEPARARLLETRRDIVRGWGEIADALVRQGEVQLAQTVRNFVGRLPPARTERERIREELLGRAETGQDPGPHLRGDTTGSQRRETPLGAFWRGFGPIRALTRSSVHDDGARTAPNPPEDGVRARDFALTAGERLRRRSDVIAAQFIAERERSREAENEPWQGLGAWREPRRKVDQTKERRWADRGERTR